MMWDSWVLSFLLVSIPSLSFFLSPPSLKQVGALFISVSGPCYRLLHKPAEGLTVGFPAHSSRRGFPRLPTLPSPHLLPHGLWSLATFPGTASTSSLATAFQFLTRTRCSASFPFSDPYTSCSFRRLQLPEASVPTRCSLSDSPGMADGREGDEEPGSGKGKVNWGLSVELSSDGKKHCLGSLSPQYCRHKE